MSKELQTAQVFTKQKEGFSEDKEWRVDLGSDLSCMVDALMHGLLSIVLSCLCFFFGWVIVLLFVLATTNHFDLINNFKPTITHTHTYKYEFGVQIQSGKCVTWRVKNGPFLASKTHQSNILRDPQPQPSRHYKSKSKIEIQIPPQNPS